MKSMVVIAAIGLAFLAGCKSSQSTEEQCVASDPNAVPAAGMINASCPVMPADDARGSGVTVAYTGSNPAWAGKQVALCCKGCVGKWEKMTPAERDERLAKVAIK